VRIDLNKGTLDVLLDDDTLDARRQALEEAVIEHQTPWQEIYRNTVGQLAGGGIIELAAKYQRIRKTLPRHSH
jgi:dihydroxy-acid dehydratase